MMSASTSRALSMKVIGATSTPIECTSKPASSSRLATRP
jgi:hypothetical protein